MSTLIAPNFIRGVKITFVFFFIGIFMHSIAEAKIISFEKNETVILKTGSTFQASQNWFFDDEQEALISPEKDITIYFRETPFKEPIDDLVFHLWKKIQPNFSFNKLQETNIPPTGRWDKVYQITYATPSREERAVIAIISVYQGKAFINLIDGLLSGLERRNAQFLIALQSWKPSSLQTENLNSKKAKIFSSSDTKNFTSFMNYFS